jgi:hypothetical protein
MIQRNYRDEDGHRCWRRPSTLSAAILVTSLLGMVLVWTQHSLRERVPVSDDLSRIGHPCPEVEPTVDAILVEPVGRDGEHKDMPVSHDPHFERLTTELEAIMRESTPATQSDRMAAFVRNMSFGDMMVTLGHLQNCSNKVELQISAQLTRRWAEVDPKAAVGWAASLPEGAFRSLVLDQASVAWAEVNWADAVEWARQLSVQNGREQVMRVIAEEAVRNDPKEALRLAAELSPTQQRDEMIRWAAMEWATADAPQAAQWAAGISDDRLRLQVLANIAMAWSDQDVQAAATLAVNGLGSGRIQADALVGIAVRWAQNDPEATAAWVSRFPEGSLRQEAIDAVAPVWALNDPGRAHEWQAAMAGGGAR